MQLVEHAITRVVGLVESTIVRGLQLRNRYPPLFVVGAPRSGTTVVAQHIFNRFRLGYFPNLAKAHPGACVTYGYLARRRYAYEPSYRSDYGVIVGPGAPSDGWSIFHRWFPRYRLDHPVREDRLHELRTIVRLFERIYAAPFANKNNANSVRVRYLHAVFPDAIFVHIKRDIGDTALSVLKSREAHSVGAGEWWSAAPPRFYDQEFATELERAVVQTWDVARFLDESLGAVPAAQRFDLDFDDFRSSPDAVIEWIAATYGRAGVEVERRAKAVQPEFWRRPPDDHGREELKVRIRALVEELERG